MKQRVYVGLSGGVDSAVSAALLARAGYDVTAAFIKIWQPEFIECTWEKDRIDAMRVAVALGIPFQEIDLSDAYQKEVVEGMVREYARGATPNPDVACNEKIKFGLFFDWARSRGADIVATGHYARLEGQPGSQRLMRGADTEKDQSYFLYRISREHMPHIAFPVGGMRKRDVRALAASLDLPVARKRDSQGLCFVGDISMGDFLRRYIETREGAVLGTDGSVIGSHDGAALYTIGQRHGFAIRGSQNAAKPHYVCRIDTAANTIMASERRADALSSAVLLDAPHLLADIEWPRSVEAQPRHRGETFRATVRADRGGYRADFDESQCVAPGQALVFYDGAHCLGGARIAARCA